MKDQCLKAIQDLYNDRISNGKGLTIDDAPGLWITLADTGSALQFAGIDWKQGDPDLKLAAFVKSLPGIETFTSLKGKAPVLYVRPGQEPTTAPADAQPLGIIALAAKAVTETYHARIRAGKGLEPEGADGLWITLADSGSALQNAGVDWKQGDPDLKLAAFVKSLPGIETVSCVKGNSPVIYVRASTPAPDTEPIANKPGNLDAIRAKLEQKFLTKEEILDLMTQMIETPEHFNKRYFNSLKFKFGSCIAAEKKAAIEQYIAEHGSDEGFEWPDDPDYNTVKDIFERASAFYASRAEEAPAPVPTPKPEAVEMTGELRSKLMAIFHKLTGTSTETDDEAVTTIHEMLIEAKAQGIVADKAMKVSTFNKLYISPSNLFEILNTEPWGKMCKHFDPKADLFNFIFFGIAGGKMLLTTHIEKLREMALYEKWSHYSPDGVDILEYYFINTVRRLRKQGKIKVSVNGKYAAFNTGLVDKRYLPIYALLERNDVPNRQPWKFLCFCIDGENMGTMISAEFDTRPTRASYFEPSDLIYDTQRGDPTLDYEHIVIEHAERLPRRFIDAIFMLHGVEKPEKLPTESIEEYGARLGKAIKDCEPIYSAIREALNRAVRMAKQRVSWNYNTAIPMYYSRPDRLCLLLPLTFSMGTDPNKAELALVVARGSSGNYLGKTIYPIDWAYDAARVVGRTYSDWLYLRVKNNNQ